MGPILQRLCGQMPGQRQSRLQEPGLCQAPGQPRVYILCRLVVRGLCAAEDVAFPQPHKGCLEQRPSDFRDLHLEPEQCREQIPPGK